MAALTKSRKTDERDGKIIRIGVAAATTIFKGALVAMNTGGFAVPGSVSTTLKAIGRAEDEVVNAGANGALSVDIRVGVFKWENSSAGDAIAVDDIGKLCYIVDDQTVALTDGTGTRSRAGVIMDVDTDSKVWVHMHPADTLL